MAWHYSSVLDCRLSFLHLPSGRCGHSTVAYHDYLVLFAGFDGGKWLNDTHFLNTVSMVWTKPRISGALPEGRQYHSAAVMEDSMFVFGGYSGSRWLGDLVVLNLRAMVWRRPKVSGDVPSGKEGHAMTSLGSSLYLFGGWDGAAVSSLHKLDTATLVWTRLCPYGDRPALCGHSMNSIRNSLYVFGGYTGLKWSSEIHRIDLAESHLRWETLQTIGSPKARGYHSSVVVSRFILIYAGYNGFSVLSDLLAFDTESRAWSFPDPFSTHSLEGRNAHTMTKLGSEIYLFGGYNGHRDTNDVHVLETAAFSTLHDDLASLWLCDMWKDVELVSDLSRKAVHQAIVKARCPPLLRYANDRREIAVIGVSQTSLELFCEFLYTDTIRDEIQDVNRRELKRMAEEYEMTRLGFLCDSEADIPESTLAIDIMSVRYFTELSDLTLLIDGEKFETHRVILACRCPYFKAMLQADMRERELDLIELPGLNANAFRITLDWMYSDKFPPLFSAQVLELDVGLSLLRDTSVLLLDSLKRMTEIALQKQLTTKNVCPLLESSLVCSAEKLKSSALNFILKHFERMDKRDLQELSEPAHDLLYSHLPKSLQKQAQSSPRLSTLVKLDCQKSPRASDSLRVLNVKGEKLCVNSPQLNRFRPKAQTIDELVFKSALMSHTGMRKTGMAQIGSLTFHRTRSSLL